MTDTIQTDITAKPEPRISWRIVLGKLGALLGLAFVFGLFAALRPGLFLTPDNIELILLQTAVVGTAALGMTVVIISGGIDLSVGSNIALCTVIVALALSHHAPPAVAAVAGIGGGCVCGLLIGTLITRLRLSPFIVTLGLLGALRGIAKGAASDSMVDAPQTWLNNLLNTLDPAHRWMLFPAGVWMMLLLGVAVSAMLRYTRFGRHVFAIGSNELTARLCGIAVDRTKMVIYVIGAGFAGLAGVLQFSYLSMGDPTTAQGYELSAIAAVVIGGASLSGGQGSVAGSLMGALIMTTIANGCTKLNLSNWVQDIVTGAIIILAVALDRLRQRAG